MAATGYDLPMDGNYTDNNSALEDLFSKHIVTLAARHDHALEQAHANHAVIYSGNPKDAFLDDYQLPFKPNPHFLGWAPLTQLPFSYLVYTPGQKPVLIYYQPRDYWHVVPGSPDGFWVGEFDIRIVHTIDEIAANLPVHRNKCIIIGEFDEDSLAFGIQSINPSIAMNILHYARAVKTPYELAVMRLSSQRGASGHRAAEAAFRNGESEFDIHRAYCKATNHTDSELPYGNIIALNQHGSVLHYTDLERRPPPMTRSLLIDAGAQVHGYASDITRTYCNDDARFQALIERMDAMQREIVAKVQSGIDYCELHLQTHRLLAQLLIDAELANGASDTLLETGVTFAFFPHGLGHLLGIQVHDTGGFMADESGCRIDPPDGHPFLRLTRVLEENMVLTIEPGLYAIDMLLAPLRDSCAKTHVNWEALEWLRSFGGIRIEDNVRVLLNDQENLTRDAFSQL